ncbi:MAG: PDDEXK nuclease domain-containing protein [Thermodesulfobacteriota bacterium]|nr:PDDEXK nuclease domain-containing protein [Thermodesulfobacteriota bacterium]
MGVKNLKKYKTSLLPANYIEFLADIKERVRTAQVGATLAANRELIRLYWDIGKAIVERQKAEGWGRAVVERLAKDLQREFPGIEGFSPPNIWRMRAFYLVWSEGPEILSQPVIESERQKLAQLVREIPWGQNIILIQKVKDPRVRLWYAQKTIEHGWSRAVLTAQIESRLYEREGKALTNFNVALIQPQSDLAQQALKDPYLFDFLTLAAGARERELEQGLIDHVQKFMLEMGVGFAFVGRQVYLEVGGKDYYLDLLFYHLKLRCFVVIDLKVGEFKPEYAGKMNFYLSAVDDLMRHPDDQPTIGLLLCKEKDKLTVEYALRDLRKPIGVAEWRTKLVEYLPKRLQGKLPSIEQIERELEENEPENENIKGAKGAKET